MNWILIIVLNCCLGSFFNGLCSGQMNIIQGDIESAYRVINPFIEGLIQTMLTIGGSVGAICSSLLLRFMSPKNSLLCTDFIAILAIIVIVEHSITCLIVSRFLIGVSVGLNSVLVPLYIKQMSPIAQAGFLGTFNQVFITLGILTSFLLRYFRTIEVIYFYQFVLLIPLIPCLARIIILKYVLSYEPPIYCIKNGLNDKLNQIVKLQRSDDYLQLLHQNSLHNKKHGITSSVFELKFRRRLFLGLSLALLQQFSGINAIIYYSSQIFSKVTSNNSDIVNTLNLIVGLIGVFTAILAGGIIEKFGRKKLFFYGTLQCFISLQLLTIILFLPQQYQESLIMQMAIVVFIFSFLIGFGFSLGPLTFLYLTEILPEQGISLSVFANWLGAALVAQMFPIIASIGLRYCFALFSLFNFIGYEYFNQRTLLIEYQVIETKGLSQHEIEKIFDQSSLYIQASEDDIDEI